MQNSILVGGSILGILALISSQIESPNKQAIRAIFVISALSYLATYNIIPNSIELFKKAGLVGRDLHRKERPEVPEAVGVVVGAVYVTALSVFLPFVFMCRSLLSRDMRLAMFMASLLSIQSMCFLGFADNVLNLKWRVKLVLPLFACLPLLLVYYGMEGSTYVKLPDVLKLAAVDIGFVFYLFLALLAVFSTNAINIYAGINGLEVGQSVVITASLILNNVIQLVRLDPLWIIWENHLFSLYLLLPFTAASLALYAFNKFPAKVFVGDTYCYLAGMTIAASGVVGQNSKTVVLFLGPQIINFIYSVPQLFKLIPCPRHRMPAFIEEGELVGVSYTDWLRNEELGIVSRGLLTVLETLKLAKIERKNQVLRVQNLTILNFVLWKLGSIKEAKLTAILLCGQIAWSVFALFIRYGLARLFYEVVY